VSSKPSCGTLWEIYHQIKKIFKDNNKNRTSDKLIITDPLNTA